MSVRFSPVYEVSARFSIRFGYWKNLVENLYRNLASKKNVVKQIKNGNNCSKIRKRGLI